MHLVDQLKIHKVRTLKSIITCLGHGCIGLQGGIIGPSLLDLRILVSCSFGQISQMVTGRFAGYAVGSVISGLIAPKTNPQLVLGLSLLISAGFNIAMPLSSSLTAILTLITMCGIVNGMTDATSNMFLIKLWAKECPPFLQALHFMFGFGSLIAPLVVEPYLKESETDEPDSANGTSFNMSDVMSTVGGLKPEDIELKYPYFIISAATIFMSLCYLSVYFKFPETSDHPSRSEEVDAQIDAKGGKQTMSQTIRIAVIAMTCVFSFIYVGLDTGIGTYIPTYAHKGRLGTSKKTGALMSSAYWLSYTCFRLVAIVLSSLIGSTWILTLNLINTIIGSVLMIVSQTNAPLFWFACVYIGAGLSSTWGSLFGFIESQFPVTPVIVTIFMVGACVGCAVIPSLNGHFMSIDTSFFLYINLGFSIIIALVFLIIYLACKFCLNTFERQMNSGQKQGYERSMSTESYIKYRK